MSEAVVDTRSLLGLPFADRGRDRGGVDCWGLVVLAHAALWGRTIPSYQGYTSAEDPAIGDWIRNFWDAWAPVAPGDELPGDVVALQIAGRPVHVGLVVGGGMMLHVLPGRPSCLEHYVTGMWRTRVERFGRWMAA